MVNLGKKPRKLSAHEIENKISSYLNEEIKVSNFTFYNIKKNMNISFDSDLEEWYILYDFSNMSEPIEFVFPFEDNEYFLDCCCSWLVACCHADAWSLYGHSFNIL